MRILIVCSGNFPHPEVNFPIYQAFIHDQIEALSSYNISFNKFLIIGKGISGYLSNILKLRRIINSGKFDLIHSHFSLSGLISILASPVPVIITFHGSDINNIFLNVISSISVLFAKWGIYVSRKLYRKAFIKKSNHTIIPCGVDFKIFLPLEKQESRIKMGLSLGKKYVLFSSAFSNNVKNYPLAWRTIELLDDKCIELIELKEYSRNEVALLMNAADAVLLTSFNEGSPQFIKEAMACNCPIVATDVGDIREVIGGTEGCFITSFVPEEVADKLQQALNFDKRTNGRDRIQHFDNKLIATQVYDVYKQVIAKKKSK